MPLISTRGAASAQGFGEFAQSAAPVYIEDVFSTYLYTGNGSTQTITNGIDLAGEGGLVWTKSRSISFNHALFDTARGAGNFVRSNETTANTSDSTTLTSFNSNGFSLGSDGSYGVCNLTGNYASWTFRKQAKFFDVVTYTGNGSNRTIAHNLGSVPGCIIVKVTNTSDNWQVYHRANTSAPETDYLVLNATDATVDDNTRWNDTLPTSTTFSLGTSSTVNGSGNTYVAYLFAHDAGGFGLNGTDNVISCGHYTSTDGTSPITVNVGFEPQWILVKGVGNSSANWNMFDVMRGWPVGGNGQKFRANTSAAETAEYWFEPTATGFTVRPGSNLEYNEAGGYRYIYIAIRRGPMKVPTSGTSVFAPNVYTNPSNPVTSGFPVDLVIQQGRNTDSNALVVDRLRGTGGLVTQQTNAENGYFGPITGVSFDRMTSFLTDWSVGASSYAGWAFRRAPGFMDVVCYTGNGAVSGSATRSIPHNLASVPELIICKARSDIDGWRIYNQAGGINQILNLNQDSGYQSDTTNWGTPTSTNFLIKYDRNWSGWTFVAYLFATVAGVSKVGSYTGSGTTKQINCGFTAGARFVLIKRTDSTGDWYVYDSARGIVAGNDPYLFLNSTAAEVTSTDYVDTYSAGFELSSTAPAGLNANGGSFIFFAVA